MSQKSYEHAVGIRFDETSWQALEILESKYGNKSKVIRMGVVLHFIVEICGAKISDEKIDIAIKALKKARIENMDFKEVKEYVRDKV